ncbi:hypothetical protein Syun_028185 [Stephania yunnanensis]|uniref:Uncharacterized protein n=1 Tax=Stephania yunnanensis TaxID=152371 RepID=A0AAP0EHA0_9MAGN
MCPCSSLPYPQTLVQRCPLTPVCAEGPLTCRQTWWKRGEGWSGVAESQPPLLAWGASLRTPSTSSESWVLHSTEEYAKRVIIQYGLQMRSISLLSNVVEKLQQEFQKIVLGIPRPFFVNAHRWDRPFLTSAIAREEKCLWDISKRLAICEDFCVSPDAEGVILSGMAADAKPS